MIARRLATLALAWLLVSCQGEVQIIPPWYSPWDNHTLECRGDLRDGECSEKLTPGKGKL